MGIPQQDPNAFHNEPQVEKATQTDSCRCPQLNKVICCCRIGCVCCQSSDKDHNDIAGSRSSSQVRGRSPTPRHLDNDPIESRPFPLHRTRSPFETASISGQEGVEDHHLVEREIGDLGNHTLYSIHLSLARHTTAWPQAPYSSPVGSMTPGPRSGSPSVMSSVYLPSLRSTESLLGFIGDGMGGVGMAPREGDVVNYVYAPLVLSIEVEVEAEGFGAFDLW
ncbi:hypothetical protein B0A48_10779 [Cryoendolithus antarcticus]|uniref:Uncharacterized protein n=1 Tax=Cryoendolithus antarcticus TaxID=1507870 RepID=A0A1V8SYM3_9PEZI|nr:hypothetical protein B0A48_10779 [Cryoendolithus antarcticus]